MFNRIAIEGFKWITVRRKLHLHSVRRALLFGCAFLVTWGSGLQKVVNFDVAKLFPLCAVGLIMYWLIFKRRRFGIFPQAFNLFMIYAIIHTCIVYGIFCNNEFIFGYEAVSETADGFSTATDSRGNLVVKFFLFAGFAYAMASLLRNQQELVRLSLFYGAGFAISFFLGTHVDLSVNSVTRSTGGFLNANSLGFSAMVATFLTLAVVRCRMASRAEKRIAALLLIVALFALFSSVARSSILALIIGLITIVALEPMRKKIRFIIIISVASLGLAFMFPSEMLESLGKRFDPAYIKNSEFGMRVPIAIDYIRQWPAYILNGVGLGRAIEVTRESYTTRKLWIPHNAYLVVLVEFGFLGLLLFLRTMKSLWSRIVPLKQAYVRLSSGTTYAGMLVAFATFFFVGTYTTREFWLVWAILATYGSWAVKAKKTK